MKGKIFILIFILIACLLIGFLFYDKQVLVLAKEEIAKESLVKKKSALHNIKLPDKKFKMGSDDHSLKKYKHMSEKEKKEAGEKALKSLEKKGFVLKQNN